MKKLQAGFAVLLLILVTATLTAGTAAAATAPSLGDADSFAVLGATTVTNTGPTTVQGDLGVSPGTAITGFPPGQQVPPTLLPHLGDQVAADAQIGVTAAFNQLAEDSCTANLTGQDLGGLTLVPGIYCFDSSAFLTGTLTLNAVDGPASVFIFRTESTLITLSGSEVVFLDGGTCNGVFWRVGSSATLGTNSLFEGNILALTSITANTGATVNGRLLARNGAVTLDSNTISGPTCGIATNDSDPDPDNGSDSEPGPSPTPTPDETTPTDTDTPPTGSNPPPTGSNPPPTGSNPPPTGSNPPPTGSNPPPTGSDTGSSGSPTAGDRLITTTHQQLALTGMNVLPLGLSGLTALLIGTGCLIARRRTELAIKN